ncbi:uncharacterized protein LOC115770549 [Drosophila novamexicana]|uniref:uncharacterized protein LOC115770549 n=1 Tax=Drosophila novamexicana TaxID=47314 RepID=UPI0011E5E4F1|nr:uncharacterized protein LOC115770549 [Drosophila novamexicana]
MKTAFNAAATITATNISGADADFPARPWPKTVSISFAKTFTRLLDPFPSIQHPSHEHSGNNCRKKHGAECRRTFVQERGRGHGTSSVGFTVENLSALMGIFTTETLTMCN